MDNLTAQFSSYVYRISFKTNLPDFRCKEFRKFLEENGFEQNKGDMTYLYRTRICYKAEQFVPLMESKTNEFLSNITVKGITAANFYINGDFELLSHSEPNLLIDATILRNTRKLPCGGHFCTRKL